MNARREAAIVRRARAGEPYADIARRFGMSAKAVNTIALAAGVRRHAPPGEGRDSKQHPCQWCGSPTRSMTRQCVTCYRAGVADEIPLTGGRWTLCSRTRVLRWVQEDAA